MSLSSLPTHPTARRYPIVGHLPHLFKDIIGFFEGMGIGQDISAFRFMGSNRYFVNNPDLAREIWQDTRFERTPAVRKVLSSVAGPGLLTQEGSVHRRQRRMMQPAFHRDRLTGYFSIMVDHTKSALERWHSMDQIEVGTEMKQLALDIVTNSLFRQERIEDVAEIVAALEAILPRLDKEVLMHGVLPDQLPVVWRGRDRQRVQLIRTGLERLIQNRRQGRPSEPPDLLDMLIETRDEDGTALNNEDIAGQALTLVSAGFETTANTLTWMWWLLASNPTVLETLRTELREVLGDRDPTLEDLPKLRFTDWTVKETQRLYPAAWLASRISTEPVRLGAQDFPKGSIFMMSPYVTHRDPRYFNNPEHFDPERFAHDANIPKFAYLPFGAGTHQCIGNIFALWEMKVILAMTAARVQFKPEPGFEPKMKIAVTLGMEPFNAKLRWR
jgi:cytochrome P450